MTHQTENPKIAVFHPSLMSRGGSQRYAIQTVLNFKKKGFDVDLLTSKYLPSSCYPELTKNISVKAMFTFDEMPITRSSLRSRYSKTYHVLMSIGFYGFVRHLRNWRYNRKMLSYIKKLERDFDRAYDIVYIHESSPYIWLAKRFLKSNKRSFLFCYDTPDKFLEWESQGLSHPFIHKKIMKLVSKYETSIVREAVEKVFVLDATMESKVWEHYRVVSQTIHGGIDLDIFKPLESTFIKDRFPLSANKIVVSNVTRLVPYRRVHDILEAFTGLEEDIRSKICLYVNALEEDLIYANELKLKYSQDLYPRGNIILDHELSKNDIELSGIYQSSDAFVFPNENQTWGNAVLEAMACGACVLVSDSCGISEIVQDGVNGLIFECGDVEAIKRFLIDLVHNNVDFHGLGKEAASHVSENLSWDSWTDKHITHFNI